MSPPSPDSAAAIQDAPVAAVRLVNVSKRFGPVVANRDVDLEVRPNTVHAIVGENGAGKSTLMKVLAGVHPADTGEVWIGGRQLQRADPNEATRLGLGMVHQHFMLVEPLTVAENLVLGREPTRHGLLDLDAAATAVKELGEQYGLPADPHARVEDLSVGERQRVEILKVLFRGAEVLVLDEPTAVLTPSEVDSFFEMLRRFVEQGRTVILITHKLDEVMDISQRVTVIRRGQSVAEVETAETTPQDLAHLMVGRDVLLPGADDRTDVVARGAGTPALQVADVTVEGRGRDSVDHVSLDVWPGEVVGIAGVQGNGQTELLECVAGLQKARSGAVRLAGRDITSLTPRRRMESGLAHIPEDRHARGLVLGFSLEENLILGRHRRFSSVLGLDGKAIRARADRLIERFDVRPPLREAFAWTLSGGNQQKVVVAREMTDGPAVLLAGQPTRGVDVGAIEQIHGRIREARDAGLGVLLVSADLAELLALSDRVAVMYEGRIVAEMDVEDATVARLGELMTGADA